MPITLLSGDDTYRVQRHLNQIRTQALQSPLGELGVQRLENPTPQALLEAVGTRSLAFGCLPLLEVNQFCWFNRATKDTHEDNQLKNLLESLQEAAVDKDIWFITPKADGKLKFTKQLKGILTPPNNEIAYTIPPFWDVQTAVQLLLTECQQEGIKLDRPVAQRLVEANGFALQPLMTECRKLWVYTGNKPVTLKDLTIMGHLGEGTFELIRQWLNRQQTPQFWQALHELLLTQHPLQLMALLHHQVEYVQGLKIGLQVGQSVDEIADRLGKKSFFIQKELERFSGVSVERLAHLKKQLLQVDFDVKTGGLEAHLALDVLMAC